MNSTTKAWLAGLIDGEGCIYFAVRNDLMYKGEIIQNQLRFGLKVAMTHKETIKVVAKLFNELASTNQVECKVESRTVTRKRPLWNATVSRKANIFPILTTLAPYFITKKVEADLICHVLRKAVNKKYTAQEQDIQMAILATKIRNGCREAYVQANTMLNTVILSQATMGISVVEGAETSNLSPNNNDCHERPTTLPVELEI